MKRYLIAVLIVISTVVNASSPISYPPCKKPFEGMEKHFYFIESQVEGTQLYFLSKAAAPNMDAPLTTFWVDSVGVDNAQKTIIASDDFYRASPHLMLEDQVYYTKSFDDPNHIEQSYFHVYYASCVNGTSKYPDPPKLVAHIGSVRRNWEISPGRFVDADYMIAQDGNAIAYIDHSENLHSNITVRNLSSAVVAWASKNITELNGGGYIWDVQNTGSVDSAVLAMVLADRGNRNYACPIPAHNAGIYVALGLLTAGAVGTLGTAVGFGIKMLCQRRGYNPLPASDLYSDL